MDFSECRVRARSLSNDEDYINSMVKILCGHAEEAAAKGNKFVAFYNDWKVRAVINCPSIQRELEKLGYKVEARNEIHSSTWGVGLLPARLYISWH